MADLRKPTVMTEADAKALGFAGFNNVPHTGYRSARRAADDQRENQ